MSGSPRLLPTLTEERLCRVWERPELLRRPLRTVDGRRVELLDPGKLNDGDGPDFLGASVVIDGSPTRGDIEFHFHTGDWRAHRHNADPRYERVILHVVFNHTGDGFFVRDAAERVVPIVELSRQFRVSLGEVGARLMDAPKRRACPLPDDDPPLTTRLRRLETLADVRLLRKSERFGELVDAFGLGEALYRALGDALGYSDNRTAFGKLTERVPFARLSSLSPEDAEATLLGFAGLLPTDDEREYERERRARWERLCSTTGTMAREEWRFAPVRVANSPARRVVALARIVSKRGDALATELLETALSGDAKTGWRNRWSFFFVEAGDYWQTHDDFGKPSKSRSRRLVGESRARDIWVNVVLPLMIVLSERNEDESLRTRAFDLYRTHPALQSNRTTRWVSEHALSDERSAPARRQQGMVELHTRYCAPRRCGECPLRGA